jgi:hypothetical protein
MSGSNTPFAGAAQRGDIHIGNVEHLNYGGVNQTSTSNKYTQFMSAHGVGYWALHFVIAAIAALAVELIFRLL